ncbi:HAD family acid phosphatase [Sphingomonas sp.]|uniref:HAD family acid phosphatase n=1 Tax=Sphingomonas sp. TaxID=28214 RepID=UPI0025DD38ED|nr:HAD family acid phosphatase [Sphingomonas sp.]
MKLPIALLCLAGAAVPLSGCVAVAAFPAAGAAVISTTQKNQRKAKEKKRKPASPASGAVVLTGLKELPPPDGTTVAPPSTPPVAGKVPPGMQYLYGSGEAAALSYQAYLGVIDTIIAKSSDRAVGQTVFSVVLKPGATLEAPAFESCDKKPLAVVLDIDETALLNLGYEADDSQRGGPYDQLRWERWEKTGANAVVATPGMIELARVAKASGVTLVFNSNRMAANAKETEAALTGAGLGPVEHLRNLWLQGDAGTGGAKDARRSAIAAKYCVIAMAGDQLGDFSDLFNTPNLDPVTRRALAQGRAVKMLWGHGWFVLPNPVYGTGLKGDLDTVFPRDKRWVDPGPVSAAPVTPPVSGPVEVK